MPSKSKKTASKINAVVENSLAISKVNFSKYLATKYLVAAAAVVLLALLLWRNKSLIVVATVNGRPIPRWNLESRMVDRFGSQILDEVINEQVILQEGQKRGIVVSDQEVNDKVTEIDKSLGGKISLKDALAGQGLSMDEFQKQIRLQLTLEKIAGSSVVVTDREVTDYIASNSATLVATDEASLKIEVKNLLANQKKNDVLRKLFVELKSKANIVKYL